MRAAFLAPAISFGGGRDLFGEGRWERLAVDREEPKPLALAFLGDEGVRQVVGPGARGRRDLDLDQGYAACRLAALNAIAQLKDAVGELSRIRQIYRLEGVLNVAEDFHDHPKALDGASDLLVELFNERARHTRMIWSNPVMPMDGFCLVYLFAEIDAQ